MSILAPYLDRIVEAYFSNPAQQTLCRKGERLLELGQENDKLYYIRKGCMACFTLEEDEVGDELPIEIFRVETGGFLGVYSYFSGNRSSLIRAVALVDSEIAWIDRSALAPETGDHDSSQARFLPLVLEELGTRQVSLSRVVKAREKTLHRLHMAEKMSTLGRLAAGLAHELNNAVGVCARSADHLGQAMSAILREHQPGLLSWFEEGLARGQQVSSQEARTRAKELMARHSGLDYDQARELAKIGGNGLDKLLEERSDTLHDALLAWETGRACYDMQTAARHAADIVRSVKQLGGNDKQRQEVSVNESVLEALALLKSNLRQVSVELDLEPDNTPIWGNKSELVQMWVNIIKNGWDALKEGKTPDPRINISTKKHRRSVLVVIANNGPPIGKSLLNNIFQPLITTKKGESMGLGLGLYIVKELVESYSGELHVDSNERETAFSIRLPLRHENPGSTPGV